MNKMMMIGCILFCCAFAARAQEAELEEPESGMHRLTLAIGHTHIPGGVKEDGKKKWLVLGSWAFDYDYWITPRFAIGLHNDFVIQNFEVESYEENEEGNILERSYPLASAVVGVFKLNEHLAIVLGAGGEFAKEESLFLLRGGLEYGWELNEKWELAISAMNDFKVDAYNSWSVTLGVSRIFSKHN